MINNQNVPKLRFKEFSGEWEEKALGEYLVHKSNKNKKNEINLVLSVNNKKGFISQEEQFDGYEVASNDLTTYKIVHHNDYAYNPSRINVGSIARLEKFDIGIVSPMYVVFELKQQINPRFFDNLYQTHKFKHLIKKACSGSVRDSLNFNDLADFDILLPTYDEQTKIATFLTAIDTKIDQLTKKQTLLKHYKKGVMQKLFSQELRFKADDGSEFSEWEEKKLGEVAKFRRGSFPQPYGLPEWYDDENGMPFIQVYDVDDNMKLKPKTKNKISKLAQPSSVFVEKGNIILTIQGSIGRIALTQYDAFVDRTLLIFTEYKKPIDKNFANSTHKCNSERHWR
jgi:type I restriction enzyme S subunit